MCVTAVVEGTAAPLPVQAGESFDGVSFLPAGTYGMVVGSRCDGRCSGVVETTSDSGATWSESGTGGVVPSLVQVVSPRAAFVAGALCARALLDEGLCGNLPARRRAFAGGSCGQAVLWHSSDGGVRWYTP